MRRQWCRLEVWEDLSYSSQLFLHEGSGEFVFVGDVRSYVLLGAELPCLGTCDELRVKLGSEDAFRGAEVVVVGVIRHGRSVSGCGSGYEGSDGVLARSSRPYKFLSDGLRIFKLPYRLRGVYVLVIDPF